MIQISPQMRVLVAIERVDGRKGIDSLVRGATVYSQLLRGAPKFQSTRPRGARRLRMASSPWLDCFNPRARAGRDASARPAGRFAGVSLYYVGYL
jgi:hypothetical protein